MLVMAIDKALREGRCFDVEKYAVKHCVDFADLMAFLPELYHQVDNILFNGALQHFFTSTHIPFKIREQSSGPAGLTTFDMVSGMCVNIHKDAWVSTFPAMVGGNLCNRADRCLVQIFLHELMHVLVFSVYIELGMSTQEIKNSCFSHSDVSHNLIFTTCLERFFGHHTIDNSLLIHTDSGESPTFARDVTDIEATCIPRNKKTQPLRVLRHGKWHDAHFVQTETRPHFSTVRIKNGNEIVVPNGLISC